MTQSATSAEEALQGLCDLLVEVTNFPLAWVGRFGEATRSQVTVENVSGRVDYLDLVVASRSEDQTIGQVPSPTVQALNTGAPQVFDDISREEAIAPWRERAREFNLWSMINIPLATAPPRVLNIHAEHTHVFELRMIDGLVALSQIVTNDLKLRESLRETVTALEGTVTALAQLTDVRDPYTQGHQSRVGTLSAEIARRLGLDAELVRLIRLAGDVHDVGKITAPAEILNKPGRLTDIEYELVKTHSQVGWNILSKTSPP
jgi:GAF domain-containing protein